MSDKCHCHLVFNPRESGVNGILKLEYEGAFWSWYDPDPVSLLTLGIDRHDLHPLLRKGQPCIPDGVKYETLMLFGKGEGIVSRKLAGDLKVVCWQEQSDNKDTDSGIPVTKSLRTVYLRSNERLMKQFGLSLSKEMIYGWPEILTIVEYRHLGEVIAWTLFESEGGG